LRQWRREGWTVRPKGFLENVEHLLHQHDSFCRGKLVKREQRQLVQRGIAR
jgi:hypothetical protein